MKNYFVFVFVVLGAVSSCVIQPSPPYVYNTNPLYTWGYAEYYGAYYAQNGNPNNVISLSLFSDSLTINSIGNLVGTGQYLYLENIYIPATEVFLPAGTYTVNKSGNAFTITPGIKDTVDNQVYPIGAYISYFEGNTAMSKMNLITDGSMVVTVSGDNYSINCNFVTADKKVLNGSFSALLPHIDQSIHTGLQTRINRFDKKNLFKYFGN